VWCSSSSSSSSSSSISSSSRMLILNVGLWPLCRPIFIWHLKYMCILLLLFSQGCYRCFLPVKNSLPLNLCLRRWLMLLVAPINACATLVVFIIDLLRQQNTYSYRTNIKNAINIHRTALTANIMRWYVYRGWLRGTVVELSLIPFPFPPALDLQLTGDHLCG